MYNDGIKRGDGVETGDNEAGPDDAVTSELEEGIEDLTIKSADDPTLGLTGTPDHPAEDWAADTGPTRVP